MVLRPALGTSGFSVIITGCSSYTLNLPCSTGSDVNGSKMQPQQQDAPSQPGGSTLPSG